MNIVKLEILQRGPDRVPIHTVCKNMSVAFLHLSFLFPAKELCRIYCNRLQNSNAGFSYPEMRYDWSSSSSCYTPVE